MKKLLSSLLLMMMVICLCLLTACQFSKSLTYSRGSSGSASSSATVKSDTTLPENMEVSLDAPTIMSSSSASPQMN